MGLIGSAVQIGGTVGSIFAGTFAKYGKKNCLMVTNIILILGCVIITATGPYGLKNDYPGEDTGLYLV